MDFTPEELKRFENRWKSDVDLKLDRMVAFMDKTEKFLDMLIEREAGRAAVRKAIIDKSITALVWGAIVGLGALIVTGVQTEFARFVDTVRQFKK